MGRVPIVTGPRLCPECGLPDLPFGGELVCMGHDDDLDSCPLCGSRECFCWADDDEEDRGDGVADNGP